MHNEIAAKYSKALFDLGKEKKQLTDIKDDINQLWDIIRDNDDLKNVVYHQRILPDDKKEIINKIFKDQLNSHLLNFIRLLIDRRREYFLKQIVRDFNRLVNKEEKMLEIKVTSAVELDTELQEKLEKKLDSLLDYKIVIEVESDPEIIGGLVLKIGDYIIDGSIKSKLDNLQQQIEKIPVSKLGVL